MVEKVKANVDTNAKKCVAETKKHIAFPAILLTILIINVADIT